MMERQVGRIETAILESLSAAPEGSKQRAHAQLFVTLINALIADGFEDQPFETPHVSDPLALPNIEAPLSLSDQLVVREKDAWKSFLGTEDIDVPNPPQELLDALARAEEKGITVFEAHFFPRIEFEQNSQYPGWNVRPEGWYWEQIKTGNVAEGAAKLDGLWVLVDGSQKPAYDKGRQLHENDPFGLILTRLRREGKIAVPDSYRHVPEISRFAVTPNEREAHFNSALAEMLGVQADLVRVLRAIEFNVLGNLYHPEWGQTNTAEWFNDKFEGDDRLIGGGSDYGGLAYVYCHWSGGRGGGVGFRPLVVFPSQ